MAGMLATAFTLTADTPRGSARPRLSSVDILPASGRRPTSMVVLLHGFGGNGESMRWVAQAWAKALPDTVFVMPDAPDQCHENPTDPASREWFATRALDRDTQARVAQIRRIEPVLNDFIDAKLAQYGLPDRALAIAGISQGAMMALHTAPRRRHSCAATVAYNGMLVDPQGLQDDRIVRMPVFAVHGAQDNVVLYANLARVQGAFKRAGFAVETVTYNLGHSVNAEGLRRGGAFIRRNLDARKRPSFKWPFRG